MSSAVNRIQVFVVVFIVDGSPFLVILKVIKDHKMVHLERSTLFSVSSALRGSFGIHGRNDGVHQVKILIDKRRGNPIKAHAVQRVVVLEFHMLHGDGALGNAPL